MRAHGVVKVGRNLMTHHLRVRDQPPEQKAKSTAFSNAARYKFVASRPSPRRTRKVQASSPREKLRCTDRLEPKARARNAVATSVRTLSPHVKTSIAA